MGRFIGNSVRCWWRLPQREAVVIVPHHGRAPTIMAPTKPIALRVRKIEAGRVMAHPVLAASDNQSGFA